MTRARLTLTLAAAITCLVALLPGCAAPTLPIPPPTALVEGPPGVDGTVRVTGNARAGAFVGCLNDNTEQGVIVRADLDTGDYSLRIPASIGDGLSVWQFESTAPGGEQIHVVVPDM